MDHTRRRLLGSAAAVAVGAAAGCLGTSGDPDAESAAESDQGTVQASFFVLYDFASHVGDGMDVHNLVPFGQHGHGWEPGPNIQRDVLDSDAFVYVGEGFQPWADKIVRNIRDDGSDVTVIEAWHGIELLPTSDDHDSTEHSGEDGHDDSDEHDESTSDGDESGHDHGAKDPHFWLDPDRAKQSVETTAAGFAEIDPENESTYTENANAFAERLTALDETYEERLSGRTKDTVLLAGHNSIRYLSHRYGFHVEALTGIAPDAEPSLKDTRRAQKLVEEHDIEYILAPVFESDRAAKRLVEETDAKEYLPLTPVPSLTDEWHEKGWGYIDVMEKVNLPSLEKALGVE
jgi:zinc transport system substrate-binding protein